jgi:mannose PTS system EIIA component
MSIGLLIITHNRVGEDLLQTAAKLFDPLPMETRTLAVPMNCNTDKIQEKAEQLHRELDTGDGVLILTDIFGSTPSNIASTLLAHENTHMVSGVCLPMVVRIFNYATLDLASLAEKAVSGGHDGIIHCTMPDDCHA